MRLAYSSNNSEYKKRLLLRLAHIAGFTWADGDVYYMPDSAGPILFLYENGEKKIRVGVTAPGVYEMSQFSVVMHFLLSFLDDHDNLIQAVVSNSHKTKEYVLFESTYEEDLNKAIKEWREQSPPGSSIDVKVRFLT